MSAVTIELKNASKWYGLVSALNDLTLSLEPGITGLLGDNGAGKSTMLKLIAGLLKPSQGEVRLLGASPISDPSVLRRLGYCPEHESSYDELTGAEFVQLLTELHGVDRTRARVRGEELLDALGLGDAKARRIGEYSKGMRQRAKIAQALAHDPDVLLLDEPLSGCDPIAKARVMEVIRGFAKGGKTVLISSHVLPEIESLTSKIVLIHKGRVVADGDVHRIRALIDEHPHRIRVVSTQARALAQRVLSFDHVVSVTLDEDSLELQTRDPDRCYTDLPEAARASSAKISSLTSPDDNMAAVFRYLTEREA